MNRYPTSDDEVRKNRAEWIAALRSGEYTQGRRSLQRKTADGFAYCCLGVACDLSNTGAWDHINDGIAAAYKTDDGMRHVGYPPKIVRRMFGLSLLQIETLVGLNDRISASFDTIADTIEKMGITR